MGQRSVKWSFDTFVVIQFRKKTFQHSLFFHGNLESCETKFIFIRGSHCWSSKQKGSLKTWRNQWCGTSLISSFLKINSDFPYYLDSYMIMLWQKSHIQFQFNLEISSIITFNSKCSQYCNWTKETKPWPNF